MKKVFNVILVVCVLGLAYICVGSIMGTINFDKERKVREREVINRLIDIRTAQVAFRDQNGGQYTDDFDQLIDFLHNGQLPFVKKVGELTDAQLEKGLNEKNVNARILEARAEKNAAKAKKLFDALAEDGIVYYDENGDVQYNYSRDTSWVAVLDTMQFLGTTNPDSICYVPYGNGAKFELATGCDSSNKSGTKIYLFEAKTLYKTYLQGVNKDELANIIDDANKLGRYAGLKVGDAEVGNNNAGNWE